MIDTSLRGQEDDEPLSADTISAIEKGLEDIRKGKTIPMDEVMKDLGIE
ncbi:MAG TPA: hypothetical protein VMC42_06075 [Methanoregulaceae archaeon]|nr:hypothetical protein [Methanoregulaceae archaeon]